MLNADGGLGTAVLRGATLSGLRIERLRRTASGFDGGVATRLAPSSQLSWTAPLLEMGTL